jgi:hypothetical protein
LGEQKNDISNAGREKRVTHHRSSRHRSQSRNRKKLSFKRIRRWIKKNPSKTIAIFSIAIIVGITVSFYFYNLELIPTDIRPNVKRPDKKNPVKGILIPVTLITESSSLTIRFGTITKSVSLKELRKGYSISPQNLINCTVPKGTGDRTKFTILLVEDRLYVNAVFKNLSGEETIASTNQKRFTIAPRNLSAFYSDDNSFKIYDEQGNINFHTEFNEPDSLSITGYFIGSECVYVVGHNAIYSYARMGNYIERIMPEIKRLSNNESMVN